jgi:hypothetical protein
MPELPENCDRLDHKPIRDWVGLSIRHLQSGLSWQVIGACRFQLWLRELDAAGVPVDPARHRVEHWRRLRHRYRTIRERAKKPEDVRSVERATAGEGNIEPDRGMRFD